MNKKMKWVKPVLTSLLPHASTLGACQSGSSDVTDCSEGLNAGSQCNAGTVVNLQDCLDGMSFVVVNCVMGAAA